MSSYDHTKDQAHGIRYGTGTGVDGGPNRQMQSAPLRVIAIASGKGGVGKTSISVNLAIAMARRGQRVMLLDADLGLANVDVMLGIHPRCNLSHFLLHKCALQDVIINGPCGIKVIPGASGIAKIVDLSVSEQANLINAFNEVSDGIDTLIVDTSAGISSNVLSFVRACQEVIMVVCDEPASMTDSYALMKVLSRDYGMRRFKMISNRIERIQRGRQLYEKIVKVTNHYLDVVVEYLGVVPEDEYLKKSLQQQRSVFELYPNSRSAIAFRRLAKELASSSATKSISGDFQFFLNRLVKKDDGTSE